MNAHFANRRALTLFWRYYSSAVRTLSQGLRCPCQSRAEDQATATPVWLWLAEPTSSLCADEGYERSGAIAGNRRPASKIVELGSGGPIQRETHYRRSPVFVSPGAGHPCVKSPGFNPSALTATSGSGPYASTLSFGAIMAAMIAAALAGSPSATKKTERTGGPPPNGSVVTRTT